GLLPELHRRDDLAGEAPVIGSLLTIDAVLIVVAAWIVVGLAGIAAVRYPGFVAHGLFPLSAALSAALCGIALAALPGTPETAILAIGLPGLPFHLRLDALSSFFLFLVGIASAGISIFSAGYFRRGEGTPAGVMCMQYHVFLAAMAMVIVSDDAYAFMVCWESMALSSYFLVTTNHR